MLRPVIYNQDLLKERLRQPAKCLVVRVDEIFIASLFVGEAEEETVGETLLNVFHAYVSPPFEGLNLGNKFRQAAEGFFYLSHAGACIGPESEQDDVTE